MTLPDFLALPVVQTSKQTLTSATPSALDLPILVTRLQGGRYFQFHDKIIDQREGSSEIEFCEFEPLWLAADLKAGAKRGRVHIQRYENGLL